MQIARRAFVLNQSKAGHTWDELLVRIMNHRRTPKSNLCAKGSTVSPRSNHSAKHDNHVVDMLNHVGTSVGWQGAGVEYVPSIKNMDCDQVRRGKSTPAQVRGSLESFAYCSFRDGHLGVIGLRTWPLPNTHRWSRLA